VEDVFERVVAENRELRKQVKTLRERLSALESSRWWRLNPRRALTGDRGASGARAALITTPAKIKRVADIWRLKADYERRSMDRQADEVVIRDGIRLKVHPEARGSIELFCYGAPEQVDELDGFIANTLDRRRLLDVGALHGVFSLVFTASDPEKRALAVDASPISFAKLLYNIHRNHAETVTAVECALSNAPGTLEMHYVSDYAIAGGATNGATALRVARETGDRVCAQHGFEPDVVKVDVEGHELRVLQGLRDTLRRARPLLFLEIHPQMMSADPGNGSLADLVDELRSLGYPTVEVSGSEVPVDALRELVDIERVLLRPE
jgi:FkbM family methyltransferase